MSVKLIKMNHNRRRIFDICKKISATYFGRSDAASPICFPSQLLSISSSTSHDLRNIFQGSSSMNTYFVGDHSRKYDTKRHYSSSRRAAIQRLNRISTRRGNSAPTKAVLPRETAALPSQIASVVGHSALIIARAVEWGTVLLGFEQANRYTIYDEKGNIVAHLLEEEGSIGSTINRQLFRTRRSFSATVLSPDGQNIIFRLRRPMYLINSTIYVEDGQGNTLGEVQQTFHLWRRKYDLFLGNTQYAAINGNFLAWEFRLEDKHGSTLALIDRNFSGFGIELFTDAGQYVIHFGGSSQEAAKQLQNQIQATYPDRTPPPVTALAKLRTGVAVIPTQAGDQLAVQKILGLDERMIALAAAISIDYDYFSRHSHGSGALSPFIHPPMIPFPMPIPSSSSGSGSPGEEVGADEESSRGDGGASSGEQASPLERDLGGDGGYWNENPQSDERTEDAARDGFQWGNDEDDNDGDGGGFGNIMDVFGWGQDDE